MPACLRPWCGAVRSGCSSTSPSTTPGCRGCGTLCVSSIRISTCWHFPAWDCLPYDRVSPNPDLISRRIDVLTRLRTPPNDDRPRLVLTTVNAATQLVPEAGVFADAVVMVRVGGSVDLDALLLFFARNGYARAQTVREPGEFALRGGIIDVFPPGTEEPGASRPVW